MPSVTVRFGCEFVSLRQDASGVTAQVKNSDGGNAGTSAPLISPAAMAARSAVRKELGIKLRGEGNLLALRQALLSLRRTVRQSSDRQRPGQGAPLSRRRRQGDATDHAGFHQALDAACHRRHPTRRWTRQFEKTIVLPLKYEMLSCQPWRQNLLLADRYQHGRVFLAGDAVHLVIPTGGLGMNSGVGDAIDLAWKLAATLQGWGGPQPLASYEFERRQVGDRNIGASRYATIGRRKWRSMWRPNIRDATPEGQADARQSRGRRRCRAAQEQRDDRRRAWLSLCRFADHLRRPGRTRTPVSRLSADDMAGRAAAARLARRRHADAGSHSATATRS